jgi:hypothetical protein
MLIVVVNPAAPYVGPRTTKAPTKVDNVPWPALQAYEAQGGRAR